MSDTREDVVDTASVSKHFITEQTNDASSEITTKLLSYGEDVLTSKFPDVIDGLKVSTRRIVWCSRNYPEPQGFSKLVGAIADVHVGGESSIIGAIIRLAQPFMVGHPLIKAEGKTGEYYDPQGYAAPRYLKAGISAFAKEIFFNKINLKTLPMVPTKDFSSMEPRYLIPRLPMALILGNLTVGFGFKSDVQMMSYDAVCDLVTAFSKFYKNGGIGKPDNKVVAPYLIPAFPVKNLVKNREELLQNYALGKFDHPIELEGWVELSGTNIILRAVPYGVDFGTVASNFRTRLKDRKDWLYEYIDSANQYSSDEAEFNITIKRGKNPFEVLEKISGLLRLKRKWTPIYSYLKNNRVITVNPPTLVQLWYNERSISIAGSLKYRQADLILEKLTIEALLIVIDHIDEVIDIVRHSDTPQMAINTLHARFTELTLNQAYILANQKLIGLTKNSKQELTEKLDQVIIDLKNTVSDFGRIHEIIGDDAQYLKKKYHLSTPTMYADDFIGCVKFGNWGIIQFFNETDLYDLLNTKWPSSVIRSIHLYTARYPRHFLVKKNSLIPITDNSRWIACDDFVSFPSGDHDELTLFIDENQRTSVLERAIPNNRPGCTICPISRNFYAIHRNGKITEENYSNFSLRKSVTGGAKTDLIYGLPARFKNVIIVHMSTYEQNVIRADLILTNTELGRVRTMAVGKVRILGVFAMDTKTIYLNIPEDCRKNSAMEFLHIDRISQFVNPKNPNWVLNTTKINKGCTIKRDHSVRSLYHLVAVNTTKENQNNA